MSINIEFEVVPGNGIIFHANDETSGTLCLFIMEFIFLEDLDEILEAISRLKKGEIVEFVTGHYTWATLTRDQIHVVSPGQETRLEAIITMEEFENLIYKYYEVVKHVRPKKDST